MAQRIPWVADGRLRSPEPSGGAEIEVGTPSWVSWLTDPASRSFSFRGYRGSFTARKELRSRGGAYWTAYRKRGGKLRKAYLGKAEDLTLERLEEAAAVLSGNGAKVAADTLSKEPTGGAHRVREGAPTAAEGGSPEGSPREVRGDPILLTKLSIPTTRSYVVPRPCLSKRLEEGIGCKLTLISAPVGFGKTTLLSAWLSDPSAVRRPVAWLSIDSADNDPARFWRYVVTALTRLQSGVGETTLVLLASPQTPPIETVLTTLLNELAELGTDSMLVLDDYHLIESRAIHKTLAFMLEHLPPRLHLIIATRADPPLPLSKLRARGELVELRASELRFATEETAEFFERSAGVELSAETVAKLEERTEGWPAGLQIAALAMRDHADVAGFIDAFAGSNRHVVDYLAEEVLERQPDHVRTFLLRTSILERMCAPLCEVVVEHGEERANTLPSSQAMLEHVEHANLFLIPLDDQRRWYRYHHLFADVLRQRLRLDRADLLPELHRRASAWFERQNLVTESVRHALAARDWERGSRLIESSGITLLLRGQIRTVLDWIDELPEALVCTRPDLCTVHAMSLFFSASFDAAEARLKDAERCLRTMPTTDQTRAILGRVAVLRATIARLTGDLESCVNTARRALELLPETESTARERAAAKMNAAMVYQVSGDATQANERVLEEAAASFRVAGASIALLKCITLLAHLRTLQGRLGNAAATYEEATAVAPARAGLQDLVHGAAYYVGLGDIEREWNDLDSAESLLNRGVELVAGPLTVDADVATLGYLSLARLQQARGRGTEALATLDKFAYMARQRDFFPVLILRGEAARARVALQQDDLSAAVRWADSSGLGVDDEVGFPREEEYLSLARVLIARARLDPVGHSPEGSLRLLDRLLRAAEDGARTGSVIEILTLRALALQVQRASGEALATLERALTLAEPEGYMRTFVDEGAPMATLLRQMLRGRRQGERDQRRRVLLGYARRLLAAFVPHASVGVPEQGRHASGSGEPLPDLLTPREREVLELIAAGLSNREIASRLFVTPGTVKWYVNIIFKKLGVKTRTQAVAEVHKLGLLSE